MTKIIKHMSQSAIPIYCSHDKLILTCLMYLASKHSKGDNSHYNQSKKERENLKFLKIMMNKLYHKIN